MNKQGVFNQTTDFVKAAKYEIQKPSNCRATLFRCKFWVNVSRFSPCVINLSRNKNICFRLKKVVAKSRARIYFQPQILPLLLVFNQIQHLSHNKCRHLRPHQANQPISKLRFFNPQQMCFLRDNLITQGGKHETSTRQLQRNNVARQFQGFRISYFAALIR